VEHLSSEVKKKYIMHYITLILFYLFTGFLRPDSLTSITSSTGKILLKPVVNPDSLFTLHLNSKNNQVTIIPPQNSSFVLPDSTFAIELFKAGDFNADRKKDVLANLGACGTGGCVYGLFLNYDENRYTLAFYNYLKNVEFNVAKNGCWAIKSTETIEPYSPLKSNVTIYKLDLRTNQYLRDTSYIYQSN